MSIGLINFAHTKFVLMKRNMMRIILSSTTTNVRLCVGEKSMTSTILIGIICISDLNQLRPITS